MLAQARADEAERREMLARQELRQKALQAEAEREGAEAGIGRAAVAEILRLDAEGLLDEVAALAGLKALAERVRALRGEEGAHPPSAPAPAR